MSGLKDFVLMIQFLTRIPIKINIENDKESFARGVAYFPIIGFVIGVVCSLSYLLGAFLSGTENLLLPTVFAVITNVLITGGLHIDGLADTCDGIFSGRERHRILEIMKDSSIGTFGTLAVIIDFVVRFALLYSITSLIISSDINPVFIFFIIISAPIISKTFVVILMALSNYARTEGMGGLFIGQMKKSAVLVSFISALVLLNGMMIWLSISFMNIIILNFGMALFFIIVLLIYRKYIYNFIGGMTGDTIGAANEIFEWVFLFITLVVLRFMIK